MFYFAARDKTKIGSPIFRATMRLVRYHMGTVLFGSFLVALVQLARLILAYVQKQYVVYNMYWSKMLL